MSISAITYQELTLVIELTSALHIGAGRGERRSDQGFVRDFNGLPGIPGTSIQGMLRSAVEEALLAPSLDGTETREQRDAKRKEVAPDAERIFGWTGQSTSADKGRGGRLWVGWGVIHNQHNQPVTEHLTRARRDDDPVLSDAAEGCLRDHVKLNERGTVDGRGKFDEVVVNPGHRFTLRLRFATAANDKDADRADADWQLLLSILSDPGLRLGGKSKRGFGRFKIISGLGQAPVSRITRDLFHGLLTPETLWMFGGGLSADTDSTAVGGTRIEWDNGTQPGRRKDVWIIAGSAVKGALVHRTRFHANLQEGNFIVDESEAKPEEEKARLRAEATKKGEQVDKQMDKLFGFIKGKDDAQAGNVIIDDIYLPRTDSHLANVQNHVAINPFTGGAKDSALFDDQPLRPDAGTASLRIQVHNGVTQDDCKPLVAAIRDLCAGRLPLGGHASRGYGVFTGDSANLNPELTAA